MSNRFVKIANLSVRGRKPLKVKAMLPVLFQFTDFLRGGKRPQGILNRQCTIADIVLRTSRKKTGTSVQGICKVRIETDRVAIQVKCIRVSFLPMPPKSHFETGVRIARIAR